MRHKPPCVRIYTSVLKQTLESCLCDKRVAGGGGWTETFCILLVYLFDFAPHACIAYSKVIFKRKKETRKKRVYSEQREPRHVEELTSPRRELCSGRLEGDRASSLLAV